MVWGIDHLSVDRFRKVKKKKKDSFSLPGLGYASVYRQVQNLNLSTDRFRFQDLISRVIGVTGKLRMKQPKDDMLKTRRQRQP